MDATAEGSASGKGAPARPPSLGERFRSGDPAAFRTLLEQDLGALTARAERLLPPCVRRRVGVLDALQEASLAAYCRRAEFEERGPDGFRRWMMGILENKVREIVRYHAGTQRRALGREAPRARRDEPAAGPWPTLLDRVVECERLRRAAEAFVRLPRDYQEVIRLRRDEGLSVAQAAQRLGRTPAAIKKLHARALDCLRVLVDGSP